MITLNDFINKWAGHTVDTDGIYPNQCMDLMHQYLIDCFGITDSRVLAAAQAKLVYTNFPNIFGHELFTQIPNTPDNIPQKGDIFFFGSGVGVAGHVCIFIDGDVWTFRSFDANWNTVLPHVQSHNYNGALGWLRVKTVLPPVLTKEQQMLAIINTPISDPDFRNKVRAIYGV